MADFTRYSVPLLACFAESYKQHDSRRDAAFRRNGGDTQSSTDPDENVLSAAVEMRRRGLTEAEFRQSVVDSLTDIVNTVDLQSSEDIRDLEYVSRSILNYGIYDLTHLTSEEAGLSVIEQNVTAALVNFEPRIVKESVQVTREVVFNDVNQSLRLSIFAELSSKPMEIPVEFVAEVDMSMGKVTISSGLKR